MPKSFICAKLPAAMNRTEYWHVDVFGQDFNQT